MELRDSQIKGWGCGVPGYGAEDVGCGGTGNQNVGFEAVGHSDTGLGL